MLSELIARLEQAVGEQAGAAFTYRECCLLLAAAHSLQAALTLPVVIGPDSPGDDPSPPFYPQPVGEAGHLAHRAGAREV